MKFILFFALAVTSLATAFAEQQSPYTANVANEIKALSPTEVDDYLNGKGMGFAKAAELNHYPGPRHVLDMADQLVLSEDQVHRTQRLFDAMRIRAVDLGRRLVEQERQLDQLFASGNVDPEALSAVLVEIATLQAEIRYVHLSAHVKQIALLTSEQVQSYDRLRGYDAMGRQGHSH